MGSISGLQRKSQKSWRLDVGWRNWVKEGSEVFSSLIGRMGKLFPKLRGFKERDHFLLGGLPDKMQEA